MSPDDFFALNAYETELTLSYDFQLRKQGGKSFFQHIRKKFFPEKLAQETPFPIHEEIAGRNISGGTLLREKCVSSGLRRPYKTNALASPVVRPPRLSTVFYQGDLLIRKSTRKLSNFKSRNRLSLRDDQLMDLRSGMSSLETFLHRAIA